MSCGTWSKVGLSIEPTLRIHVRRVVVNCWCFSWSSQDCLFQLWTSNYYIIWEAQEYFHQATSASLTSTNNIPKRLLRYVKRKSTFVCSVCASWGRKVNEEALLTYKLVFENIASCNRHITQNGHQSWMYFNEYLKQQQYYFLLGAGSGNDAHFMGVTTNTLFGYDNHLNGNHYYI